MGDATVDVDKELNGAKLVQFSHQRQVADTAGQWVYSGHGSAGRRPAKFFDQCSSIFQLLNLDIGPGLFQQHKSGPSGVNEFNQVSRVIVKQLTSTAKQGFNSLRGETPGMFGKAEKFRFRVFIAMDGKFGEIALKCFTNRFVTESAIAGNLAPGRGVDQVYLFDVCIGIIFVVDFRLIQII